VPAPGVPAAALMARPEKMMVSVHIESLLLLRGYLDISKPHPGASVFRYV